jgi:ketosteroid isomerase-like protein
MTHSHARSSIAAAILALLPILGSPASVSAQQSLKQEAEALLTAMVVAFKADPASVAKFYLDDATIVGGGQRTVGRAAIDRYWASTSSMFADLKLELTEVGGDGATPWIRGTSTLVGRSGRTIVTEFIGLLKRQPDGTLRFYVDMFAAAPAARAP